VPNRYAQQRERKLANKAARQQELRDKELDEAANAPAARMTIRRKGHSFIAPELKDRHLAEMRPAKYTIQAGKWHWYFEEGDHSKVINIFVITKILLI
jgi:alkylation response protein AidB-like acyl-CoA dehydrogenase